MTHFVKKISFFFNLSSFTALNKNGCLKQILIFLLVCLYTNLLRKTNFLIISEILSKIVTFWTKKRTFHLISPIMLQTTEKHSLTVFVSFLGEKKLLLKFVHFYWFDQKELFKQIQNFLLVWPSSNLLRKIKFLSISVLLSEMSLF